MEKVFGIIIVLLFIGGGIYWYLKREGILKPSPRIAPTPATPATTTGTNPTPKKKKLSLGTFLVTLLVIVLTIYFGMKAFKEGYNFSSDLVGRKENVEKKPCPYQNQPGDGKILKEREVGYVGPGQSWTTGKIDYNAKFRSNGHAFYVQFTSKNGGWTTPELLDKDFEGDIPVHGDMATPGTRDIRALVTPGPNETALFRVQLYQKL